MKRLFAYLAVLAIVLAAYGSLKDVSAMSLADDALASAATAAAMPCGDCPVAVYNGDCPVAVYNGDEPPSCDVDFADCMPHCVAMSVGQATVPRLLSHRLYRPVFVRLEQALPVSTKSSEFFRPPRLSILS